MQEHFLWVEKYRPRKIEDCILPQSLKASFQQFVDQGSIPNLILSGGPGVGKTTVARAMLEELGCDYIIINGSLNGNIDTLRTEIKNYASTMSLTGGRKYVILDEADYLNAQSTQPALRNFMEEFSRNCGFILTCNFKNRIIEPLHSRCSVIEFLMPKEEKPKLGAAFFRRVTDILSKEDITADGKVVAELITKYFPDWRRILNELQRYAVDGKIDTGILTKNDRTAFTELIGFLKVRDFKNVRKWVATSDIDSTTFFRKLYDESSEMMKEGSIPQLVLILADYQYKNAFVADHEINLVACLTEVMSECEFK